MPKSQATSFTLSINYCRRFRDELEIQPTSTISICFDHISTNITLAAIETPKQDYALWHNHCHCLEIRHPISQACTLCKYTCKVILCMVLISERHLGPDIWPETVEQAESINNMIRRVWFKEAHRRQKASEINTCALSTPSKEAKYVNQFTSWLSSCLLGHRFWILSRTLGFK